MRTAPRLTSLELRGIEFSSFTSKVHPLLVLAGMPLRHLVLHVVRPQSDLRRSTEEAVTSVLADLPQLISLDISFPRCVA